MILFKKIKNFIRLWLVQVTVNKYSSEHRKIKLNYRPLIKRPVLKVMRIKNNNVTQGILVASQKTFTPQITYVDYIWLNSKILRGYDPETKDAYYQAMYDLFMLWHEQMCVTDIKRHKEMQGVVNVYTIAISININNNEQIEKFRRILTLYGYSPNIELTLKDVEFTKPYREKEQIKNVVYTRTI